MIYIFSPSIDIDRAWTKVKEYVDKLNIVKDQTYYNHYNPDDLEKIINNQYDLIEYQKEKKKKNLFAIAIMIDDFFR